MLGGDHRLGLNSFKSLCGAVGVELGVGSWGVFF
jgi:hypothetical protein